VSGGPNDTSVGEISVKTGNNARNGGKNSLNRLIRCVCGKKIGSDPRNFNQRVSLGRNDLLIRTFPNFKVKINKKYFAYQLKAKFDSEKEFARGSTLKTITKEEFSKFQLPLPSINEQNRIVSLLDKFDTLAHSIKQGLPREIELRQKQYEYYRDLLFSFPKPETVSN
ncbi:restriction endonuclease subunit S, partial [Escherichia marmotae]|uniref:restriction endonuclease subunit S n=1 Tax=Escherichia marmotae TaxID=1499973 RepID=UPI001C9A519B